MTGRALLLLLTLGLLTACSAATPAPRRAEAPAIEDDRRIAHVLGRLTYGPRPGEIARVRAIGLAAWIGQQLDPGGLDDAAVDGVLRELSTLAMPIPQLLKEYPRPDRATREKLASGQMTREELRQMYPEDKRPGRIVAELQAAKIVRAVASERQLQEVMVDFWFNHFNVFAKKDALRWYAGAYEREAIRPLALGKFPDLVRATAGHPAMLAYLDNWLSARADFIVPAGPNRGRRAGLNENYARELMELHTLGVDGGYTQKDVTEVARAFTGWTIDRPQAEGRFVFRAAMHDPGEKVVLGQRIPAGGGQADGERVIEILTRHPSTARFIAGKLVRRFVSDDPPAALVERVSRTYAETGGDIRAMLRVILTSPEFHGEEAYRAKIKKPLEFVASGMRALGGTVDARGGLALAQAVAEIGEPLYEAQPPTGYADRAEAWVNTGALLARMNFALGLLEKRLPGVSVDVAALLQGTDRSTPEAVLDRLLGAVLGREVSRETRAVLRGQLGDPQITRLTPDDRGPATTDVEKLAALVIGSPEFQRR
ncbi:MAG: DUF1800 domain-containing protein [Candidatus Rokubacteria bacterium]|nr:DUF1800 domain-containing protein [Candidatus Rokubacteria bacterium]